MSHTTEILALLAPLHDAWLASLVESYRTAATNQAAGQQKAAIEYKERFGYHFRPYQLVIVTKLPEEQHKLNGTRNACIAGRVAPNYPLAEKAAAAALASYENDFSLRLDEKIDAVFGRNAQVAITAALRCHGCVEGTVTVQNGQDEVVFDAAGKNNYRYGENSANGDITCYSQYPFRILSATLKGAKHHTLSAEEASVLVRGVNPVTEAREAKLAAKLAKDARRATIERLTKIKSAYNDQASTLGAAETYKDNAEYVGRLQDELEKRALKHGLDLCLTKRDALAKARGVLALIRETKASPL